MPALAASAAVATGGGDACFAGLVAVVGLDFVECEERRARDRCGCESEESLYTGPWL